MAERVEENYLGPAVRAYIDGLFSSMADVVDQHQPPLGIFRPNNRHLRGFLIDADLEISLQLRENPTASIPVGRTPITKKSAHAWPTGDSLIVKLSKSRSAYSSDADQ